jgi:hypothetical protein
MDETLYAGACMVISNNDLAIKSGKIFSVDRIIVSDEWFKDALMQLNDYVRLPLIDIDCDLYRSTIDSLDFYSERIMRKKER